MLFLGIVAASLIFLSAYGGMVSLAQVAIYGVAGFALGNLTTNGNTKGLNLGWAEAPGIVVALVIAVIVALRLRRAGQPQLRHLLPDDHARLLGDREPVLRPGHERVGLRRHQRHPDPRLPQPHGPPRPPVLRHARGGAARLRAAALRRAHAVRADAAGHPRRPGAHELAGLQRHAAPHAGLRLRRLHRRDRRGPLRLVERADRAVDDRPERDHRRAGDRRDRRASTGSRARGWGRSSSCSSTTTRRTSTSSPSASTR